ncbi:biotin/lipoyl-containing protein, partial [Micromonospora zhanjiangensis]
PEPATPPAQPAAEQQEKPQETTPAQAAPAGGEGTVVKMPALGESVTEGTVTRWLKEVGDTVEADEPLLEVSTDKVDTEIPSPAAGTLTEIKVGQDETAAVGAELAVIGAAGNAEAAVPSTEQPTPEQGETQEQPESKPAEPKPERVEEPTPGMSYSEPAPETEVSAQPARTERA